MEQKIKIGDEVFFINSGYIYSGVCYKITISKTTTETITIDKDGESQPEITHRTSKYLYISYDELNVAVKIPDEVFLSKEELIQSLSK